MALAVGFVAGNLLSQFIGKQIIGQAITDASSSIYQSLRSVYNHSRKIDAVLTRLDIQHKIETIEGLIQNITTYNSSVEHCLSAVHDTIVSVKEDLKRIEQKVTSHRKKYFARWRKLSCSKEVKSLTLHSELIDKRLDYLLKAVKIQHYNMTRPRFTDNKMAVHAPKHIAALED